MSTIAPLLPSPTTHFHRTTTIKPPHFTPKTHRKTPPKMSTTNNPTRFLTSVTKLIFGKSLPPQLLISTVRTSWSTLWLLMMSQLAPSDPSGSYTRPTSRFLKPKLTSLNSKSLHLYAALPCPWAHRTLIVRALKGLEHVVPVSIASPGLDGSWVFKEIENNNAVSIPGQDKPDSLMPTRDKVSGVGTVKEVYKMRKGGYDGRCTVPMLWDVANKEVVCNESYDIIELLNSGFNDVARCPDLDLCPVELKGKIEEWNGVIYPHINNGVYRCGFAQSQEAYDTAVNELFSALDKVDDHLKGSRYLCGDKLTLADVCLFTTLIRFDLVYNVMFKCTKKKVVEYPSLHGYMRDLYQIPGVAETCNLEAMMDGYYKFLFPLNPGNIRPIMPTGSHHETLLQSHNRESLSTSPQSVQVLVS
ncbi:glutathione S-transferase family protein [Tanacetum coccineum]|uniref:Glutathione S-transferase family protein n=1 Tax=Tanacetum coccineum TaxID=301880 RepID=A0ABQ5AFV8_9ASTR